MPANQESDTTASAAETRPPAMASSSTRAPPPPPLFSLNSDSTTNSIVNGISRSTTPTSIHRRPHSDSVSSKNSSVHFDLEDQSQLTSTSNKPSSPSRQSSNHPIKASLPNGLVNSPTINTYQPVHPSNLHTSTIPSPPKSAPLLSTHPSSSSMMNQSISNEPSSSNRPGFPKTHSSQDRRVWSETLPQNTRNRSGSVINQGKRPSRVTGGFETSSSGSEESSTDQSTKDTGTGTNTPGTMSMSENAVAGPSRPRAKSLLGPTGRERQSSDASGASRDAKRRREEHKRPKRRSSKEPLPQPSSRMVSYRSNGTSSPPKITPQLPQSRSDSYFGYQNGSSPRSSRTPTAKSSPLIESTIPMPNNKSSQLSRGRSLVMLKERSTSSEGHEQLEQKGKAKEIPNKSGDLASSLGLGIGGMQDMALNPEQLRNLLSDSDISSALRLMNSPHVPASRPANVNDWSNSVFFSPPNTRPPSPGHEQPKHHSPYLVSAPPALTTSDNHGRGRTMSVASSVAPPLHSTWGSSPRQRHSMESHASPELSAIHRRRASSKAGMLSENQGGGHVPFTHHLPVPQVDQGSPERELDDVSDGLPAITEIDTASAPSRVLTQSDKSSKEGKEKEKKSRLSNIFLIGKKKPAVESNPHKHDHHLLQKDHRTDKQKEEDRIREKEKYEKDIERRRLEQERRDEELAQERRFRALTQVAAHPSAERRAYTAGAKLRAFYSHVFEGIEDPPKLNPLAIIRWRLKTEEQNEARERWEHHNQSRDHHSHQSDKSGVTNSTSPYNHHNHLGGNIHSSPMSVGSSNKLGARKSIESSRSVSLGSLGKFKDNSPNQRHKDNRNRYERGWGFSVDDIMAYKVAKGHVNYFIPPRRSLPDVDVMTEDERGFSPSPQADTSRDYLAAAENRKDDQSSLAGSSKKSHVHKTGVKTASNVSLMNVEGMLGDGDVPLSRSTSIETGGKSSVPQKNRLTHRTHQSLSAVGQTSLTHALKQPFEKLSHVAKKQRNLSGPSKNEGETHHIEHHQSPVQNTARSDSAPSPYASSVQHQNQPFTPMSNRPSRTTINSSAPRNKENGIFRRYGPTAGGAESFTDEELLSTKDKEFHLRKLFLKGQKVLSSSFDIDHSRRSIANSTVDLVTLKQNEREKELLALEAALMRESAFRERQAEASRKTQLEIEARERIRKLENEIYAERVQHLDTARQKLQNVTDNISIVDDAIRQYLYQIDFLADGTSIACDIDVDWSSAQPLRATYGNTSRIKPLDEDEHRDTLPPMRSFTDSHNSGSDLPRRQRTNSFSTRKARSQSIANGGNNNNMPRRKGSLNASLVPIHHTGNTRHQPRRTYLDPSGMDRVDPVKQTELVLSYAREKIQDMFKEKLKTNEELELYLNKIDGLIKRKENVRKWTREKLELTKSKKSQLDQLYRQDSSKNNGLAVSLFVLRDNIINTSIQIVGGIIKTLYYFYSQIKGELWFFVKWLNPCSYWCIMRRKTNDSHNQIGSNGINHKNHNENNDPSVKSNGIPQKISNDKTDILDDFGSAPTPPAISEDKDRFNLNSYNKLPLNEDEERRPPYLVPLLVMVLAIIFGFYYSSRK
ncbi:uncharacterized protein L201_007703 [Kwoniella dendrophila CBS 6074]|uniref:Uncharacterized protein n=1 Tax=Kwoniella dendrophila CBS 6074 TaxID=1295534 RepID=A0AAX4K5S9_9TREE